jgi:dipeptidase D
MEKEILKQEPASVWSYFYEICQIPRPSKKEAKIGDYLCKTGERLGLEVKQDKVGNVLISKPATKGKENVTPVTFQSHMDMVCEKNNDVAFNFDTDAIQPYIDGQWLRAKGTTLGADDGIGMAIALALLADKTIVHGPIECLFTVDEETGLTGAFALKPDFLKGKMLLNLDSEDEGQFFIGCAGGKDTVGEMKYRISPVPPDVISYKITVKGLQGGHSGDDINKERGNAVQILTRILRKIRIDCEMSLSHIDAGNLRNAIAREGVAIVVMPIEYKKKFERIIVAYERTVRAELRVSDPNVRVMAEATDMPLRIIEDDHQLALLDSLCVCPHGVLAMSQDIEGFVETSTNLASVKMNKGVITIATMQRSSVDSKCNYAAQVVSRVFAMAGIEFKSSDGYPGWTPNPKSKVLTLLKQAYTNVFDKAPLVLAIHAGLECGIIGEKYPDMDMISYGPTLRGVHSPDERLLIESVQQVWDLTLEFLRILK